MHALIIEDHVLVADLVKDCLKDLGYTSFDVAISEADAVAAAGRTWPDMIIADEKLREGTGLGAVTSIRQVKEVPVVFASAEPDRILEAYPAAIVLTKPFLIDAFAKAISTAISQLAERNSVSAVPLPPCVFG